MTEQTLAAERATETLDTSDLLCPLPVHQAALALNRLKPGDTLRLITTDPGALEDIPALARQRGDELVEVSGDKNRQVFLLRKGSG